MDCSTDGLFYWWTVLLVECSTGGLLKHRPQYDIRNISGPKQEQELSIIMARFDVSLLWQAWLEGVWSEPGLLVSMLRVSPTVSAT